MYRKVKVSAIPKRRRLSISRFEKTKEWKLMEKDLERGLKPNEALQIVFTEEDKKKYQIKNRLTIARFLKKYLSTHKLSHSVKTFGGEEGDFIVVQHKTR